MGIISRRVSARSVALAMLVVRGVWPSCRRRVAAARRARGLQYIGGERRGTGISRHVQSVVQHQRHTGAQPGALITARVPPLHHIHGHGSHGVSDQQRSTPVGLTSDV